MTLSTAGKRIVCSVAAVLAVGSSAVVSAGPAQAASSSRACPSQRTVAHALTKYHRKHLVRSHYHPNGVYGVRCSGRWAAAAADYRSGSDENAYPVLAHRTHGHWHEVLRDKPCLHHRVPKKIYNYACNSS